MRRPRAASCSRLPLRSQSHCPRPSSWRSRPPSALYVFASARGAFPLPGPPPPPPPPQPRRVLHCLRDAWTCRARSGVFACVDAASAPTWRRRSGPLGCFPHCPPHCLRGPHRGRGHLAACACAGVRPCRAPPTRSSGIPFRCGPVAACAGDVGGGAKMIVTWTVSDPCATVTSWRRSQTGASAGSSARGPRGGESFVPVSRRRPPRLLRRSCSFCCSGGGGGGYGAPISACFCARGGCPAGGLPRRRRGGASWQRGSSPPCPPPFPVAVTCSHPTGWWTRFRTPPQLQRARRPRTPTCGRGQRARTATTPCAWPASQPRRRQQGTCAEREGKSLGSPRGAHRLRRARWPWRLAQPPGL